MRFRTRRRVVRTGAASAVVVAALAMIAAPADALSVEVSATTGLHDGDVVHVTIEPSQVGSSLALIQCDDVPDASGNGCDFATAQVFSNPFNAIIEADLSVRVTLNTSHGVIDCAERAGRCTIAVATTSGPLQFQLIPLTFEAIPLGVIEGVVHDPDGAPIAGAVVIADCFGCEVETGADGRYRIEEVRLGPVEVRVGAPTNGFFVSRPWGDSGEALEVFVESGLTTSFDVELEYGGRVSFDLLVWGSPASGDSSLCVDGGASCVYGVEDVPGTYRFAEAMPPGTYTLDVWPDVAPFDQQRRSVAIAPFDELHLEVAVEPAILRGIVTSTATGAPVPGVSIEAECSDCGTEYAETEIDGSYEIYLAPGHEYQVVFVPPHGVAFEPAEVTVTMSEGERRTLDIDLTPLFALVIEIPGEDVLTVDACRVGGETCWYSVVGRNGRVEVGPVVAGEYDVRVRAPRPIGAATAMLADVEVPAGGATIAPTLRPDSDFDGLADVDESASHGGISDSQSGLVQTLAGPVGGTYSVHRRFGVSSALRFMALRNDADVPAHPGIAFPDGILTGRMDLAVHAVLEIDLPREPEALYLRTTAGQWERVDGGGLTGVTLDGTHAVMRVFAGSRYDLDPSPSRVRFDLAPGTDGVAGARITEGPTGFVTETTADFVVDVPAGSSLQCSLDLGAFAPCSSTPHVVGLSVGTHALVVQAVDALGHASTADFRVWYAGATSSGPRLGGGPAGVVAQRTASFAIVGSPTQGSIRCFVDMERMVECGDGLALLGLGVGPHIVVLFDGNEIVDLRYWVVHRPVTET